MLSTVLATEQEGSSGSSTDVEHISVTYARPAIGLSQRKVLEIDTQLTDFISHDLYFDLTLRKVAGHETGKTRRHNVRQVVGNCSIAVGQENTADPEAHGTFPPRLAALLAALVGVETVAQATTVIRQAFSIHGHGK